MKKLLTLVLIFGVNVFCYSQTTNENEKNQKECSCPPGEIKPFVTKKGDTVIVIEEPPMFPGGEAARLNYLRENLIHLQDVIDTVVFVRFCVDKDGSITGVEVIRGINDYIDKEVVRVIETMPNWEPGKQRGRPICTPFYMMPIRFPIKEFRPYMPIEQPQNTSRRRNRK